MKFWYFRRTLFFFFLLKRDNIYWVKSALPFSKFIIGKSQGFFSMLVRVFARLYANTRNTTPVLIGLRAPGPISLKKKRFSFFFYKKSVFLFKPFLTDFSPTWSIWSTPLKIKINAMGGSKPRRALYAVVYLRVNFPFKDIFCILLGDPSIQRELSRSFWIFHVQIYKWYGETYCQGMHCRSSTKTF